MPECETEASSKSQYLPLWTRDAIPYKGDGKEPWKCKRYKPLINSTTINGTHCSTGFNTSVLEECSKLVYATDDVTIVNEVSI